MSYKKHDNMNNHSLLHAPNLGPVSKNGKITLMKNSKAGDL